MELKKAEALAKELMALHDVTYRFAFNNRKAGAGLCSHSKATIFLSRPLTSFAIESEVRDTILHEIAHALTRGHGHDQVWKKKAIEIGCNGLRCYDEHTAPEMQKGRESIAKYKAVCVNGHIFFANRRKKRRHSCPTCFNRFDERFILNFKPNL